jgi:hypothetical protein
LVIPKYGDWVLGGSVSRSSMSQNIADTAKLSVTFLGIPRIPLISYSLNWLLRSTQSQSKGT